MRVWLTADLHLGHENIIRLCERPFANVDEMNAALIDRWNSTVTDRDVVYVLGDFAMGRIADTLPLAQRLHGMKILVPGNHDRCWGWRTNAKARDWKARYAEAGFIVLGEVFRQRLGGVDFRLAHLPYSAVDDRDDQFADHRAENDGMPLLHGHVHQHWKIRDRQVNVGVDVWDYAPVSIDTVLEHLPGVS